MFHQEIEDMEGIVQDLYRHIQLALVRQPFDSLSRSAPAFALVLQPKRHFWFLRSSNATSLPWALRCLFPRLGGLQAALKSHQGSIEVLQVMVTLLQCLRAFFQLLGGGHGVWQLHPGGGARELRGHLHGLGCGICQLLTELRQLAMLEVLFRAPSKEVFSFRDVGCLDVLDRSLQFTDLVLNQLQRSRRLLQHL